MSFKKIAICIILFFLVISPVLVSKKSSIRRQVTNVSTNISQITETLVPVPTKILDTGLPNIHLIKTAFIPQAPEKNWDLPWQDACEEAALLTVDYFYKNQAPSVIEIKNAILDMISFETKQSMLIDINLEQMAIIASQYLNYTPKIIDNPTVQDIKQYISQDIPVIVPANGKTLYKENKNFRSGGPWYHNIVILGYDDNQQKITVHDVGTQYGAYFKYSYSLLMESNHDFPTTGRPEDINSGPSRVLVLLK